MSAATLKRRPVQVMLMPVTAHLSRAMGLNDKCSTRRHDAEVIAVGFTTGFVCHPGGGLRGDR
jgi:hypothetical protein